MSSDGEESTDNQRHGTPVRPSVGGPVGGCVRPWVGGCVRGCVRSYFSPLQRFCCSLSTHRATGPGANTLAVAQTAGTQKHYIYMLTLPLRSFVVLPARKLTT